jgi:hypothetical protein
MEQLRRFKWPKGVSGNPKGRPRSGLSLAERIREKVDPDELIDIALEIARGNDVIVRDKDGSVILDGDGMPIIRAPEPKDRINALNFLAERGWIKPPVQLELDAPDTAPQGLDFSRLSDDELDHLEGLLSRAAGQGTPMALVPPADPEPDDGGIDQP